MNNKDEVAEIILVLIALGQTNNLDEPLPMRGAHHLKHREWLERISADDWFAVAEQLPIKDLETLMKALTVLDKHYHWGGSSVSAVIWLYRVYQKRFPLGSQNLANWLLHRANHYYIPFGSDNYGARNIDEYIKRRDKLRDQDKQYKEKIKRDRQLMKLLHDKRG